MDLTLYNSLTRRKEAVAPAQPGHLRLYACGPTVYSYAHIGNARMAVVFDLLVRVARRLWPRVTYVSNITDVSDKITAASEASGEPVDTLTQRYERVYNEDMAALGCAAPDVQPRATEHIGDMIALIEKLLHAGNAYEAQGHVLFSVPSYPAYGALSGRSREEQIAGARVEVAPYKTDPADFVLWKPAGDGELGWDSPWGRGRPGWHIECSAMAQRHLGLPFDIHGGGADLKFPHHENEIAQSCCACGASDPAAYTRLWAHNGFVTVGGEKMSKSVGNVLMAHDLLKEYDGEVLRWALLSAHYRKPLDWTKERLELARKELRHLYMHIKERGDDWRNLTSGVNPNVMQALCDDLNTPLATSHLLEMATNPHWYGHERDPGYEMSGSASPAAIPGSLIETAQMMGFLMSDPDEWLGYAEADPRIDALLTERQVARKARDFARADEIRDQLAAEGIAIEDTPEGPTWRRA